MRKKPKVILEHELSPSCREEWAEFVEDVLDWEEDKVGSKKDESKNKRKWKNISNN